MLSLLVIDDEYGLAEVLAATLGDAGHRVTVTYSGELGLARLCTERFDAVLLDLMMPGMGGDNTLAAIRQNGTHAQLPIVLLSERTLAHERVEDSKVGYLTKPFTLAELATELGRLGVPMRPT